MILIFEFEFIMLESVTGRSTSLEKDLPPSYVTTANLKALFE
jgi:hypothetical protein